MLPYPKGQFRKAGETHGVGSGVGVGVGSGVGVAWVGGGVVGPLGDEPPPQAQAVSAMNPIPVHK